MANNLRKIRTEQGLTQRELSRRSQVSRPTIIKLESDETLAVQTSTLVKLADALDRSVAEIFFE